LHSTCNLRVIINAIRILFILYSLRLILLCHHMILLSYLISKLSLILSIL